MYQQPIDKMDNLTLRANLAKLHAERLLATSQLNEVAVFLRQYLSRKNKQVTAQCDALEITGL